MRLEDLLLTTISATSWNDVHVFFMSGLNPWWTMPTTTALDPVTTAVLSLLLRHSTLFAHYLDFAIFPIIYHGVASLTLLEIKNFFQFFPSRDWAKNWRPISFLNAAANGLMKVEFGSSLSRVLNQLLPQIINEALCAGFHSSKSFCRDGYKVVAVSKWWVLCTFGFFSGLSRLASSLHRGWNVLGSYSAASGEVPHKVFSLLPQSTP